MITSKLTTKAQTTLPRAVRAALGVAAGDEVAYKIEGEVVVLTKASRAMKAMDDPFAVFSEWDSAADREAYADL